MRQDKAVDGFRLAYERTGPGSGAPAALLLHGWPASGSMLSALKRAARSSTHCDGVR